MSKAQPRPGTPALDAAPEPPLDARAGRWPPRLVWAVAAAAAILRALPFLKVRLTDAAAIPVGYNPADFLSYVALARQPTAFPGAPFVNPFTTEAQSGRFVLVFHQLLNVAHRWTGVDPFLLLELARPLLIAVFVLVLWRLVRRVIADARERVWAAVLVLASGGLQIFLLPFADVLPEKVGEVVRRASWTLYGWSTFESLYNPLWVAAFALLLALVQRALAPARPAGAADVGVIAAGLVLLWFTHPYSALAFCASLTCAYGLESVFSWSSARPRLGRVAAALLAAAVPIAAITSWQLADDVYRSTSGGVFGRTLVSPSWYPVGLGAVCFLALVGWREWVRQSHPWRFAVGGWTLAVVLLHSSDVLNGYHFLPYLHVPVCLVAAAGARRIADAARTPARRVAAAALAAATFVGPFYVTLRDLDAAGDGALTEGGWEVVRALARAPAGRVLSTDQIGVVLPAYTDQRVFLGHWFMTPEFDERKRFVDDLVRDPAAVAHVLRFVVESQGIDYVVVPAEAAAGVRLALGVPSSLEVHRELALLRLR